MALLLDLEAGGVKQRLSNAMVTAGACRQKKMVEEGAVGGFGSHVLNHLATSGALDRGLSEPGMLGAEATAASMDLPDGRPLLPGWRLPDRPRHLGRTRHAPA